MANSPFIYGPSGSLFIGTPQGAAGTVLTNDGAGNLTWDPASSGPTLTTFNFANNTSSFTNVTGFSVNPSTNHAFTADISIERQYTGVFTDTENTSFYTNLGSSFNGQVSVTAVQSNGQILVGGFFTSFNGNTRNYLVRLNSDGTEDTSFYTNLGSGFGNTIMAIYVQSNGQILVGGSFGTLNGNSRGKVVRLNSDGTEDTTFATNIGTGANGTVNAFGQQSTGTIIVGGQFSDFNSNGTPCLIALNSNGTADTTFNGNITGDYLVADTINSIAVQSNDQIILGGSSTNYKALLRLNSDGTRDTTFYSNIGTGAVPGFIFAVKLQSNGQVLIGGTFTTVGGTSVSRIARLNSDGTKDTTFITNVGSGANNTVSGIIQRPDSNIIIVGDFTTFNGTSYTRIAALTSTGTTNSTLSGLLGTTGFSTAVYSINLTSGNQFIVGGAFTSFNGNTRNYLIEWGVSTNLDLVFTSTIKGVYYTSTSTWLIQTSNGLGDNVGVDLNMTNAGQMQYTSSNLSGTDVLDVMKFTITGL